MYITKSFPEIFFLAPPPGQGNFLGTKQNRSEWPSNSRIVQKQACDMRGGHDIADDGCNRTQMNGTTRLRTFGSLLLSVGECIPSQLFYTGLRRRKNKADLSVAADILPLQ
jgi:hypothetical protein